MAYLPPWRTPWFSCSSSVRTPAAISLLPFLDRLPKAVAADPGLLRFGPPEPFSFDGLIERARRLAAQLYVPPPAAVPEVVQQIDYDAHHKLAFKLRSEWRPPADRRCV